QQQQQERRRKRPTSLPASSTVPKLPERSGQTGRLRSWRDQPFDKSLFFTCSVQTKVVPCEDRWGYAASLLFSACAAKTRAMPPAGATMTDAIRVAGCLSIPASVARSSSSDGMVDSALMFSASRAVLPMAPPRTTYFAFFSANFAAILGAVMGSAA